MDSSGLPSIQDSRDAPFRAMTKSLDPKCPDFGRKAMTSQVRCYPQNCSAFATVFNMFFPFVEVANSGTAMWKLWGVGLQKQILYLLLLWLFLFPNIFMASTSVNKQMQTQQCGSCGV